MSKLTYTLDELRLLAEEGTLNAKELTDTEVEMALNDGLLEWTRENANRLLK